MRKHTTFYVQDVKPFEFCGQTFYQLNINGAFELPTMIEPTSGEHDFNICEQCKKGLQDLLEKLTVKFNGNGEKKGFPFCCTHHANLVKLELFNRNSYLSVPEMTAKKVIYTNQHIGNNLNAENWYKIITDYIDYVYDSFGQMPKGFGEPLFRSDYLHFVSSFINSNRFELGKKGMQILEFIERYKKPINVQQVDINILISTYQKWLNIFPFEIESYFGNLKEHYKKNLPLLRGNIEENIYSKFTKSKVHTKSTLIESLINLTNDLLTKINGLALYEKGKITDTDKIKFELIINSRKLKLQQGYKNNSPDEETKYRRIIKEWFADEKQFIKEIEPLLKSNSSEQIETKSEKLYKKLTEFGFFTLPSVNILSESNKKQLIDSISTKGLPYSIAMFDFLGFFTHLKENHFSSQYRLNKEISKWFCSDKEGRTVKGNISSMSKKTKENKERYTAYKHKENVKEDYQLLK